MHSAKHLSFLLFSLFLFQLIRSQDVIYLNNGTKFDATVKEINAAAVKYKNFNNPDGPTYVIAKNDVLFIEYKNGTLEILNKNPISLSPVKTETVVTKPARPAGGKETKKTNDNINYMNKNCLYLNGLAFVNSDIALIFDREICKQRLSLVLLGAYNFNIHTNYTNSYIQALGASKKNYDLGFGINYYTQTRKNSQYFVGLLFKVMHYEYVRETTTTDIINGLPHTSIKMENANGFQFSSMLVNGLQFRMNPFFTYRVFVGLGFTNKDADISRAVSEDLTQKPRSLPKAYLGMCVGYRF